MNQWIANCGLAPGMLGCGVRLPGGVCQSQSFDQSYPREGINQALQSFGETFPTFQAYGLAPRWLTWTFEQGQLRVARRPDGWLVGLAVQPHSPAAEGLDQLTADFLALDLSS